MNKLKNPKILWGAVAMGVVIVIAIIATIIFFTRGGTGIFNPGQIQVYFFNQGEGRLTPENRPRPYGYQEDWVAAAIGHLRFPPNSRHLSSTWPDINPLLGEEETPFFSGFYIEDGVLTAQFYDAYLEMPLVQEALFRSAFTLTMVDLPFIDSVRIQVNGIQWEEDATTIANAPAISPARLANTQFVLYMLDASGEGLVRKYYNAVGIDTRQRTRAALEALIGAYDMEDTIALIPQETRVLAVVPVTETASIYVNLSSEFLTRFSGGSAQASFMLQSIVNTVLENSIGATQVFFLIDFAREEHVPVIGDLSGAFEYDYRVMLGFVEEDEDNEDPSF